ncbi:hypothetical protein ACFQE0_09200 [Methylobacterium komagatae]|uniref:Uncharacterized protein n=1 Tax=Methylobacterium komagatae TaxID=374425 RepID=A0ABW2BHC5_9HYPH
MRLLGRILLGAFALLLAVPAGGIALSVALLFDPGANAWLTKGALAGLDVALGDLAAGLPPEGFLLLVAGLAKALFVLLFIPPALVGLGGGSREPGVSSGMAAAAACSRRLCPG